MEGILTARNALNHDLWQIVLSPVGIIYERRKKRKKRSPDWDMYEPSQPYRKALHARPRRQRST